MPGTDGGGEDGGTSSQETIPTIGWLNWIPQSHADENTDLIRIDVPSAANQFTDETLTKLSVNQLSEAYDVEVSQMSTVITATDPAKGDDQVVVLEAPLNPDELLTKFSVPSSETEEYMDYVIDTSGADANVAFSESGLVLASDPRPYIDAKAGNRSTMAGTGGDVERVVARVDSFPFSAVVSGDEALNDVSLSTEPLWAGPAVQGGSGQTVKTETHMLFPSASTAQTVLTEEEDKLRGSLDENQYVTNIDLSLDGRFIVGTAEADSFIF